VGISEEDDYDDISYEVPDSSFFDGSTVLKIILIAVLIFGIGICITVGVVMIYRKKKQSVEGNFSYDDAIEGIPYSSANQISITSNSFMRNVSIGKSGEANRTLDQHGNKIVMNMDEIEM
jgi:hypothetical protein